MFDIAGVKSRNPVKTWYICSSFDNQPNFLHKAEGLRLSFIELYLNRLYLQTKTSFRNIAVSVCLYFF